MNFLFSSHPLYRRKPDEDYAEEFMEALKQHSCALFSYEDLEVNGTLTLCGEEISGPTIYRGWMMTPELYKLFYEKLLERNIILINTPEEYNRFHMLPGWYEDFQSDTVKSLWTFGASVEEAMDLLKQFSQGVIVKDYVKSRKHEWYDACYIPDVKNQDHAETVIRNFVERQGDSLVGGIVFREYQELNQLGYHEISKMPIAEEYRAFIYYGKVMLIDNYWEKRGEVALTDAELAFIDNIAAKVKSNFVTVDLARRKDGKLIIMEFGDGQVSGLQQITAEAFYQGIQTNDHNNQPIH